MKEKIMTATLLQTQVSQLGDLRRRLSEVESQEESLARAVRSQMVEHGQSEIVSGGYKATLIRQERLTVKPELYQKAVGKKDFVKSVTVNITAARQLLGEKELRRISEVAEVFQLRVAPMSDDRNRPET
jgi:hypothetical protein